MPTEPTIMKLLVASVRNKIRTWRDNGSNANHWEPVCSESSGHRIFAPSPQLCAVTDIGQRRIKNEDEYFLSMDGKLWILADGMGGHAAGELASRLTIQAIVASMEWAGLDIGAGPEASFRDRLMTAFAIAQDWVTSRSRMDDECQGMGSTAIAGVVDGDTLHLCHVGDVRGYQLSGGHFRRITSDHSWVWESLVKPGMLTPDQARFHPQRGKVTQAIGSLKGIKPELNSIPLKTGDRVLLCSDGLWEALADENIAAIIGSYGSIQHLASALVDRANTASGEDNITAILYEHKRRLAASGRPSQRD